MRITSVIILALVLVAGQACGDLIGATNDPLEISIGSRAMGMGGVYAAVSDDSHGLFNNPAAIARQQGLRFSSMSTSLLGDVNYSVAGVNHPLRLGLLEGGIGIGMVSSSVGEIISPTATGMDYFDYHHNLGILTFAQHFDIPGYGYSFDAGIRLKYFDKGFGGSQSHTGTGMDIDLGILAEADSKTEFGVVLSNALPAGAGGKISWPNGNYEGIPMTSRVGVASRAWREDVLLALDYELIRDPAYPGHAHLGLEWELKHMLKLRAGLDQSLDAGSVSSDPTFGVGIRIWDFNFDYAYHPYFSSPGNISHYFSLSYGVSGAEEKVVRAEKFLDVTGIKDRWVTYWDHAQIYGKLLKKDGIKVEVEEEEVRPDYYGAFNRRVPLLVGKNLIRIQALSRSRRVLEEKTFRVLRLATFKDLKKDYWAKEAVERLATLKIISGYPDGEFKPDHYISRAEMVALFGKLKAWGAGEVFRVKFTDVSDKHWAYKFIAGASESKVVTGFPDGTFRPSAEITRSQGVAMINRFAKLAAAPEVELPFEDMPESHWASEAVKSAFKAGMLEYIKEDMCFDPNTALTRGEVVELLYRTALVKEMTDDLMDFNVGYGEFLR